MLQVEVLVVGQHEGRHTVNLVRHALVALGIKVQHLQGFQGDVRQEDICCCGMLSGASALSASPLPQPGLFAIQFQAEVRDMGPMQQNHGSCSDNHAQAQGTGRLRS